MQKRIKNTSLFVTWLAIGVLFLHAAVPHRQHLNSGFEPGFEQGTMDANTTGVPVSCQWFRNLSFEKPESNTGNHANEWNFMAPAINPPLPFRVSEKNRQTVFPNPCETPTEDFLKDGIPVRGSPALA